MYIDSRPLNTHICRIDGPPCRESLKWRIEEKDIYWAPSLTIDFRSLRFPRVPSESPVIPAPELPPVISYLFDFLFKWGGKSFPVFKSFSMVEFVYYHFLIFGKVESFITNHYSRFATSINQNPSTKVSFLNLLSHHPMRFFISRFQPASVQGNAPSQQPK